MKDRYILSDFAEPIAVAIQNAKESHLDRFVGLEHYDSGEPVISRYSDTSLLGSSVKEFHKNDILIARRNVYLKRAGICLFDGLTSGDSIVLRIYNDCEKRTGVSLDLAAKIIPFVVNSNSFWAYANKHADGMNSKRISKEKVLSYEFSLPSLTKLKVLADKLWAAYEVKQSYLNMIDATNQMVKAKFVKMFGDPVKNDKNWDVLPVEKVAPESPSLHGKSGNVWVLNLDMVESQTGKVLGKVYTDSSELNSVNAIDKGNVLLSKLRPYLNKVVLPDDDGYATTELVPLRPNQDKLNLVFFCCLLRGDSFVFFANKIATGLKMPRLPMDVLRSFKVILPPMEMQNEFASIYTQAEQSIAHLNASVEAIDKVIRSLINENL